MGLFKIPIRDGRVPLHKYWICDCPLFFCRPELSLNFCKALSVHVCTCYLNIFLGVQQLSKSDETLVTLKRVFTPPFPTGVWKRVWLKVSPDSLQSFAFNSCGIQKGQWHRYCQASAGDTSQICCWNLWPRSISHDRVFRLPGGSSMPKLSDPLCSEVTLLVADQISVPRSKL